MSNKILTPLVVLCCVAAPLATQQKPAARSASAAKPVTEAPAASETLALQIMLDRSGFSSGEIDGKSGANVKQALSAFRRANGLSEAQAMGEVLASLSKAAGGQPPFTTYEIVDGDVAGPFIGRIPADMAKQAKLPSLGYTSALEGLAEKFHCSPSLLRSLNPGVTFTRAGERIFVPNVEVIDIADRTPKAAEPVISIVVREATSALTIEAAEGRVLAHMPVTVGSVHDPLPIGNWKVTGVERMPKFHYNPKLFWDAKPEQSKATLPPGPNSPVGIAWIDISKPHYGIHGTPEPSRIGHTQSHGCIRLTNWDVARVAQWAKPGTPVVLE